MSEHTKVPHTNGSRKRQSEKPYTTEWRRLFKKEISKQTEQGLYLQGLRHREGLTQKQLAEKLGEGVSQHHISEMENGKRSISPKMAKRLAKVLGTDYRMFL